MAAKDFAKGGRASIRGGMDRLDEAMNARCHDEQVAKAVRAGVPIGVRSASRDEDGDSGRGFHILIAHLNPKLSFQDIPRFIIFVVYVHRRDQSARLPRATGVLPFGDDEAIIDRANRFSRERRCRRFHRAVLTFDFDDCRARLAKARQVCGEAILGGASTLSHGAQTLRPTAAAALRGCGIAANATATIHRAAKSASSSNARV